MQSSFIVNKRSDHEGCPKVLILGDALQCQDTLCKIILAKLTLLTVLSLLQSASYDESIRAAPAHSQQAC